MDMSCLMTEKKKKTLRKLFEKKSLNEHFHPSGFVYAQTNGRITETLLKHPIQRELMIMQLSPSRYTEMLY